MPRPRRRAVVVGLAAALPAVLSGIAVAHVAPSTETNNRYIKLQPIGDRVRLAYTIYFGELPGAEARRQIDVNNDSLIDDSEANAHGRAVAAEVLPRIEITADGAPLPLAWAEVHVGLGMPTVAAGAYSVDLVAWLCLAPRDSHELLLRDHLALPFAGENELRVDEAPGIRIERPASVDPDAALDLRWNGPGGPLAEAGYTLRYAVDRSRLPAINDSHCPGPSSKPTLPRWLLAAALAAVAIATTALVTQRARKKPAR